MNAKKNTGALRAILVALSVVSMLMTGLFVVNTTQAGADPIVCPDGFSVTEDQKSCYATPVVITKQAPPACVDADGEALGHITPNNKACIEDVTYLDQDPTPEEVKIAADTSSTPGSYTCPIGWSGPDAKNQCTTTSGVPASIADAVLNPGTSTAECTAGVLNSDKTTCTIAGSSSSRPGEYIAGTPIVAAVPEGPATCMTGFTPDANPPVKCFVNIDSVSQADSVEGMAGVTCTGLTRHANNTAKGFCQIDPTPGAPAQPERPAVSATCEGEATSQTAEQCVVTTVVEPTTIPAIVNQAAGVYVCPVGFSPTGDVAKCTRENPAQTITRAADAVAGTSTSTCPTGFSGPTSEGYCTRTELTAQKQIPTCDRGTLLRTGNDFVCLLDNTPVYPDPTQAPECPRGTYDAKTDLCFVPAVTGTHPGSVTVVPKTDAQAASGSTAPAPAFTG